MREIILVSDSVITSVFDQLVSAVLAGVKLGDNYPIRIMGIINASAESFYKGSIKLDEESLRQTALAMVREGSDIIDIGARSTAPNRANEVPIEEESSKLRSAVEVVSSAVRVPISVDTTRSSAAKAALEAGAEIVNDVSGLKQDPNMKDVISENRASAILVASDPKGSSGQPIARIEKALADSLAIARAAGILEENIALDPGLGFFRKEGRDLGFSLSGEVPWYVWDCAVIRDLGELLKLGRPINVSISRKSFIGKILGLEAPEDRLFGSLSATSVAAFNGAKMVRTHDVAATLQAVRIAEKIRKFQE